LGKNESGMIRFVVTEGHKYTVAAFGKGFGVSVPPVAAISYAELFSSATTPAGTYIFADIERLVDSETVLAAEIYRVLRAADGCRVLNDPATVRIRYGLLRRLREAGLNDFDSYRADGCPRPSHFPVFVRRQAEHAHALSGLLRNQEELDRKLDELVTKGESLRGLIVIEFCAEPVAPGIFRRYGMFRIGEGMHLDHIVTEDSWNVKFGKLGLADEAMYEADHLAISENLFAEELRAAFELGGIDYGRADFGVVNGRPQVYEINTNPYVGSLSPHPSPIRSASSYLAHLRFARLLEEIYVPDTGRTIALETPRVLAMRAKLAGPGTFDTKVMIESARLAEENRRLKADLDLMRRDLVWRVTSRLRRRAKA